MTRQRSQYYCPPTSHLSAGTGPFTPISTPVRAFLGRVRRISGSPSVRAEPGRSARVVTHTGGGRRGRFGPCPWEDNAGRGCTAVSRQRSSTCTGGKTGARGTLALPQLVAHSTHSLPATCRVRIVSGLGAASAPSPPLHPPPRPPSSLEAGARARTTSLPRAFNVRPAATQTQPRGKTVYSSSGAARWIIR